MSTRLFMNKAFAIFLIIVAFSTTGYVSIAQTIDGAGEPHKAKKDNSALTKGEFRAVLNQQFAGLVSGKQANSIGNFASVDLKDAEVSFGGVGVFKRSVLQVNGSGSVSDGVFSVFKNSTLNTKVSLDMKYHWLRLQGAKVEFFQDRLGEKRKAELDAEHQYFLDSLAIADSQILSMYKLKRAELGNRISILQSAINTEAVHERMDSLKFEMHVLTRKAEYLNDSIVNYSDAQRRVMARNKRADALAAVKPDQELYSAAFGWFSLGYKIQKSAFKTFDNTLLYSDQVQDVKFVTHQASLQYSYYKWTRQKNASFFADVQATFSYTDNFDDLKKVELVEKKNYGQVTDERTSTKTYSVYAGGYKKDLVALKLSADYYHFFLKENVFAAHIFPSWTMKKTELPIADVGLGLFLALKNTKDEKAIVNMELYYQFNDLFKMTETTYKLFERNSIGIKFAFPLSFKTK